MCRLDLASEITTQKVIRELAVLITIQHETTTEHLCRMMLMMILITMMMMATMMMMMVMMTMMIIGGGRCESDREIGFVLFVRASVGARQDVLCCVAGLLGSRSCVRTYVSTP